MNSDITILSNQTPEIIYITEELECNICFLPERTMTEESNICLHWNKICKDCKRTLFKLNKNECPYCKKDWEDLLKVNFLIEIIIELFKEGVSNIYECFTDEEANNECKKVIKEFLYEIDYNLISQFFREGCHIPEEVFKKLTRLMGDDANPIIEILLTNTDDLANEFVRLYGRGKLLAEDDIEIQISIHNHILFLYNKDD